MKRLLLAGVARFGRDRGLGRRHAGAALHQGSSGRVVSPAYNWSGFYIGAMGGYGWDDDATAAAALAAARSATTGNSPAASSFSVLKSMPPAPASRTASPKTSAAASWLTAGHQDQLIRQRDRPCRLRDGCGASLRQGRFCVGQQQGLRFQRQRSACRFRIAKLIPDTRSAAASNICSRRTGRPRANTCTPASAARPIISVAIRWIPATSTSTPSRSG